MSKERTEEELLQLMMLSDIPTHTRFTEYDDKSWCRYPWQRQNPRHSHVLLAPAESTVSKIQDDVSINWLWWQNQEMAEETSGKGDNIPCMWKYWHTRQQINTSAEDILLRNGFWSMVCLRHVHEWSLNGQHHTIVRYVLTRGKGQWPASSVI